MGGGEAELEENKNAELKSRKPGGESKSLISFNIIFSIIRLGKLALQHTRDTRSTSIGSHFRRWILDQPLGTCDAPAYGLGIPIFRFKISESAQRDEPKMGRNKHHIDIHRHKHHHDTVKKNRLVSINVQVILTSFLSSPAKYHGYISHHLERLNPEKWIDQGLRTSDGTRYGAICIFSRTEER